MIIDEASMVRSDLMDAVDVALRKNRNRLNDPFGGVQMVLIGDLFQLPPVVPNQDKEWLFEKYSGQYFFDAPVFRTYHYVFKELTKVFRQSEEQESFKELLNNIRDGNVTYNDMVLLNSRHKQNTKEHKDAIFLTARRSTAYMLNYQELEKIESEQFEYTSTISGRYEQLIQNRNEEDADEVLPAPNVLKLKKGAQIMMLRNDPSRRWVNGSIGKILKINKDGFSVLIDSNEYKIERENWKEVEYVFNNEKQEIEEIVKASFIQFPVRLAYAITIHKSQGKTFDKITVDIGSGAFAPGQIYVALSRATTLQGIVLNNPININDVIIDERIRYYYQNPYVVPPATKTNISADNHLHIMTTLSTAISDNKKIKIEYENFNGDKTERILSQIQVSTEFGNTHIQAYCHYRNEERTFKVNRIMKISIVD